MSEPIPEQFSHQARLDFQRARFKAFINRVWSTLSGQPTTLLSYDEIKEKLHIGGPIYRGVQTVRVDHIAGSLNRYHEFDRVFLPASDKLAPRWTISSQTHISRSPFPMASTACWNTSQSIAILWVLICNVIFLKKKPLQ